MAVVLRINNGRLTLFRPPLLGTGAVLRRCRDVTDDPMPGLRNRAYELADTARFADWSGVAAELAGEGVPDVLVRRLGHDRFFQIMLKNRIAAARD